MIYLFFISIFLPSTLLATENCAVNSTTLESAKATAGLTDELNGEFVGAKWEIVHSLMSHGQCLHILEECSLLLGEVSCQHTSTSFYEVVVSDEAGDNVQLFESAFNIPSTVRAAIGKSSPFFTCDDNGCIPEEQLPTDLYYAEFSGASAIEIYKAYYTGLATSGFKADISAKNIRIENNRLLGEPDGKLPFDPTPGRTWKVKNPEFSLKRGQTAEVGDINAGHFDRDFHTAFTEGDGKTAPWGSSFLRKIQLPNGDWVETEAYLDRSQFAWGNSF